MLEHMLDEDADDYICVSELVGEDTLVFLANIAEQKAPESSPVVAESILDIADRVYANFPTPGEGVPENEDLPSFDPENFNQELENRFGEIQHILNHGAVDKADEEFPVLIDMFEVRGITFAFQLQDRKDALESVLDYMVETEDYETAATVKSVLKDIGSDKVKQ